MSKWCNNPQSFSGNHGDKLTQKTKKPPVWMVFYGYGSYVEKIIYNLAMASVEKGMSLM